MQFEESRLLIEFDDRQWQVVQYDKHRYYRHLSGHGLKGADFIGIWRDEYLVIVEVKNYQVNPGKKGIEILNTSEIVEHLHRKLGDTVKGIIAAQGFLQRKRLIKFLAYLRSSKFFGPFIPAGKWTFWLRAHHLLTKESHCIFLIILLPPLSENIQSQSIVEKLRAALYTSYWQVLVVPSGNLDSSIESSISWLQI